MKAQVRDLGLRLCRAVLAGSGAASDEGRPAVAGRNRTLWSDGAKRDRGTLAWRRRDDEPTSRRRPVLFWFGLDGLSLRRCGSGAALGRSAVASRGSDDFEVSSTLRCGHLQGGAEEADQLGDGIFETQPGGEAVVGLVEPGDDRVEGLGDEVGVELAGQAPVDGLLDHLAD